MEYEQLRAKLGSKIAGVISSDITEISNQECVRPLKVGFTENLCRVTFSLGNYEIARIDTGLNLPRNRVNRGGGGELYFGRYRDRVDEVEFTGDLRAQFIFEFNFELEAGCDIKLKNIKRYLYHILKQQGEKAEEKNNSYITRWIVGQVVDLKSDSPIESLQDVPKACVDACASVMKSMIQRMNDAVGRLAENLSPDGEISLAGEKEIVDSVEESLRNRVKSGTEFDDRSCRYFKLLDEAGNTPISFRDNYLMLDNNKREDYCQLILTGAKMFVELSEEARSELFDKWLTQEKEIGSSQYRSYIKDLSAWAVLPDGSPLRNLCSVASSDDLPGIVCSILRNEEFIRNDKAFRGQRNNPLRRYLEWAYSYIRNSGATNAADLFKKRCYTYPEFLSRTFKLDFTDKKMKKEDMKTSIKKSVDSEISAPEPQIKLFPNNRILFGAPGTGKSYQLKEDVKSSGLPEDQVERVTFHPEYSYFDFVGAYKPKMKDERIVYGFVPGPFVRTLKKALLNKEKTYLLIIEEINRARVAAVFGDMFQLLDRDETGASEYGINPSEELKEYLEKEGIELREIEKIRIPGNMNIWATMNSADQGVYPMDTAFKRRWNFEYTGIDKGEDKVKGEFADDWKALRKHVNELLQVAGINEDKQMGPFFLKGTELQDEDSFVAAVKNKVLMYLFEDAAKHKRKSIFLGENAALRYSSICAEFGAAYKPGEISAAIDGIFQPRP